MVRLESRASQAPFDVRTVMGLWTVSQTGESQSSLDELWD